MYYTNCYNKMCLGFLNLTLYIYIYMYYVYMYPYIIFNPHVFQRGVQGVYCPRSGGVLSAVKIWAPIASSITAFKSPPWASVQPLMRSQLKVVVDGLGPPSFLGVPAQGGRSWFGSSQYFRGPSSRWSQLVWDLLVLQGSQLKVVVVGMGPLSI